MNQNLYDINRFTVQTSEFGNYSPSTASFSSNGSTVSQQDSHSHVPDAYHSPDYTYTSHVTRAGVTDYADDFEYKLRELETVMMGTEHDYMESFDGSSSWGVGNQRTLTDIISRKDVKELLIACAKSVAENDTITADWLMSELRPMVSVSGEPIHRLGAYMLEGLVARLSSSGSSIYKALRCKEPTGDELFSYMRVLYEVCPYFKFGYLSANGAIAEAMKNENKIHIIDFQIASEIEIKHLAVRPGEPLVVNFAFMLHHMPDESVNPQNPRDRLLRMVKSLSPKVVTLVEQESNVNTAPFFNRFQETLNYYTAIFESIDETLPRNHQQRINVEQHCLARDIVNIIACEGVERVERHELLGKWRSRFTMAGFTPYPLSSSVNSTIKSLLQSYSEKYRLEERDGALFLGWMNRDLVASCAWR
ncbi:putative transcription factor GRAS family [Helianthus annuus]|nr:putative transcription factor GRAS family [Helianthus annuus]